MQRRLAAILMADVVGYSRLIQQDEPGTLARLAKLRTKALEPAVAKHKGRIVKFMGDGVLVELASATSAVQCAIDIQKAYQAGNKAIPEDQRIVLRIGVNLGDVIVDGDDLMGDGVNVAARLQATAEPGEIRVSQKVCEEVEKARIAFEDLGEVKLKNMARPVRVFRVSSAKAAAGKGVKAPVAPRREKPSVAVLPFDNMSGDPDQEYFSDGITEDIITAVSRFRSLFVIARNSSFAFRGQKLTVPEIADRLGVDYVLEGSVRRAGNRVRITAQLIEGASGNHVWSERYDRGLEDVFAVQEEVAGIVASSLYRHIETDIVSRVTRRAPENIRAYELMWKGVHHHQQLTKADTERAKLLLQMAIAEDPNYGEAYVWLGMVYVEEWFRALDASLLSKALECCRRSVELDPANARSQCGLGYTLMYRREFDQSEYHHMQAFTLNPSDPHVSIDIVLLRAYQGRPSEGDHWHRLAMQLNPFPPLWYKFYMAINMFCRKDYDFVIQTLHHDT